MQINVLIADELHVICIWKKPKQPRVIYTSTVTPTLTIQKFTKSECI